jgi:hypothetical protein
MYENVLARGALDETIQFPSLSQITPFANRLEYSPDLPSVAPAARGAPFKKYGGIGLSLEVSQTLPQCKRLLR